MKRTLAVLFCVLAAFMPLFAGGSSESAADEDVTLTVLWFNDANESEVFEECIQDFLAENPNVKVDVQVVAFGDYQQRLKMMISGGNPPDLARLTTSDVTVLASSLAPVDPYLADPAATKAEFMPSMLAFVLNKDGEMIGYPTEATANGMLVNLTAWENAGIDVRELSKTWTWPEWEEAVKKVIAANEGMEYGLAVDYTMHRFATLLYQFGGSFMNEDQTAFDMVKPENIATIEYFKHLHDEGLVPESVWLGSENPAELFQAGLVACHIGGSWNINTYNTNVKDFEWCAVNSPKGEIVSSVPGGKFIAAFKDSDHLEEAMALMASFSDKQHNEQYCLGTFNISSRTDAEIDYPTNSEDFAVFQQDLMATPAFTAIEWSSPEVTQNSTFMLEQVVQALMGNITADQACQNIQDRIGG